MTKIELSDKSFFVLQNQSIKFPFFFFFTFFSTFLLIRIARIHRTKSLHCPAQKKKKKILFLPIFITRSFTRVQQLLSTVCKRWKGSKGATLESKLPFCCAPLFRVDHRSITGSIRNISSASLLRNASPSPGEQWAAVYLLILTRSNCQFALLSRGAVKTIRASRRLFANKPRARAFISPSGDVPPSPPSRSKLSIESFQGYLCEFARKKIGPLSMMVFDDA